MWKEIREFMLIILIIFCILGAIAGLVWLIVDDDNTQAEKKRAFFLECYEKTNDAGWCYDND